MTFLEKFDKLLTGMNDYLPFAGVVFIVGSLLQKWHQLDATYISFTTTILGFVGYHAYLAISRSLRTAKNCRREAELKYWVA